MDANRESASDEIIFEVTVVGGIVKVCAMDPGSLTEVVVQGPVHGDRAALVRLARQKLAFVLARHARTRRSGRG